MKQIDHLYYINLDKRQDRNEHIVNNVLPKINFPDNITTRISAVDTTHEHNSHLRATGCTLSHLKIYEDVIANGYNYFMVLEDDFKLVVSPTEFKDRMRLLFDKFPKFDVCQIAFNEKYGVVERIDDIFMKGKNIQTTSGYVMSSTFCSKLIPVYQDSIDKIKQGHSSTKYACDQIWKQFQSMDTWILTRCGVQLDGYSDIEGRKEAYGC